MADEDMREMVDAIQEAYLIAKKTTRNTHRKVSQRRVTSRCALSVLWDSRWFIKNG